MTDTKQTDQNEAAAEAQTLRIQSYETELRAAHADGDVDVIEEVTKRYNRERARRHNAQ